MPVYNVETYLDEAIQSVLNQTYPAFELIIVNDGSTDKSGTIAEKYASGDKRIKLIHKDNGGLSSARNEGLSIAVGEFIYFMDSDDTIVSNTLADTELEFRKNDVDLVLFTARSFNDPANFEEAEKIDLGTNFYSRSFLNEGKFESINYYKICTDHSNFVASACLYVAKREIIQDNNLIFHKGIIHEDELFTRQLLFNCIEISFVKKDFYNRRVRQNSISTASGNLNKARSFIVIAEELFHLSGNFHNLQLFNDSSHFYKWAINLLESERTNTKEYNAILKLLFNSPLQTNKLIGLRKKLHLQYKVIDRFKQAVASARYKLRLGTRLRKLSTPLIPGEIKKLTNGK